MTADGDYRRRKLSRSYWPADRGRPLLDWTLGQALRHAASAVPDRTALVEGLPAGEPHRRWTFAELWSEAERVAAALLTRFQPGERVAVWAANTPEWELILYGCALAGIVMVTVNPAYRAAEVEYVLGKSAAAGLFTMDCYRDYDSLAAVAGVRPRLPGLREVIRIAEFDAFVRGGAGAPDLPAVDPGDACVIMFTSGTTGRQKGVILNHRGLINMATFTQERGGLAVGGVFVNPMPMFHIGALGHAGVGAVIRQATHVLAREWDPALYMSLVERERGTFSLLVPTMIEAVLAHPGRSGYRLGTLRNLTSGASVVEMRLIRRTLAELGCAVANIYGQTEMQGAVTGVHPDDAEVDKASTIGQPLPHLEVRIADPVTGEIRGLGEQGEIQVRGYQNMIGYFNMPAETAGAITPEGWLRSGDLGEMDERGFLRITGRIKDMIIRGGENIYPREIENLLLEHPAVDRIAVIGVPDAVWGEQVGAIVIPAPGASLDPAALYAFCRERLAAYKAPRLWYRTDAFPMTETGKLQKFRLVEAVRAGALRPEARF